MFRFSENYVKSPRNRSAIFCCLRFIFQVYRSVADSTRIARERERPVCGYLGQHRHMGGHDSPTLWEAYPEVALPALHRPAFLCSLKLQGNLAVVGCKCDDVQAPHGSDPNPAGRDRRKRAISSKPCRFSFLDRTALPVAIPRRIPSTYPRRRLSALSCTRDIGLPTLRLRPSRSFA